MSARAAIPALVVLLAVAVVTAGCSSSRRALPPSPSPPATEAPRRGGVTHVVERGQTLWRIARAYEISVEQLARANAIEDATNIRVGQALFVPGARAVIEVPPAPGLLEPRELPDAPGSRAGWRWPADGPLTSRFGAPRRGGRLHKGIDIGGPRGTPVRAAREGRVVFAGTRSGYGKLVVIEHDDGFATWYAHLRRYRVRVGEKVRAGERLGGIGRTGRTTGYHLHFEIRHRGRAVDPLTFLP